MQWLWFSLCVVIWSQTQSRNSDYLQSQVCVVFVIIGGQAVEPPPANSVRNCLKIEVELREHVWLIPVTFLVCEDYLFNRLDVDRNCRSQKNLYNFFIVSCRWCMSTWAIERQKTDSREGWKAGKAPMKFLFVNNTWLGRFLRTVVFHEPVWSYQGQGLPSWRDRRVNA